MSEIHSWVASLMGFGNDFMSQTALSLSLNSFWFLLLFLVVYLAVDFNPWRVVGIYLSLNLLGFLVLVVMNFRYELSDYSYYSGIVTATAIIGTQLAYWLVNRNN